MKCPYAVNRKTVSQTIYEYNEDGIPTFQQTVEENKATFPDCLKQQCGAWKDGHCAYNE